MKNKKPVFFIILAIAILMTYTAANGLKIGKFKILGAPDMRFGIDIKGGVNAVFEPEGLKRKPTMKELEAARTVIEVRLDQNNILDRDVTIDKNNGAIIVNFPWKSNEKKFDPEKAMAELGQTAELTFKDDEGNVIMKGEHVSKATPEVDQSTGKYVVSLTFDEEGTKLFGDATKKLVGKNINIFMDKENIQTARVIEAITEGNGQIEGMKDYAEAKDLADKINSGALPFSMITKNHSTISPTLGSGALSVMVQAGLIAFIIICCLLIVYYRVPGFVACISLLIQISGSMLFLSIPQITLTLQGVAGIILSIGLGVDANVIVSERINEEIRSGKSVHSAIMAGFKNAFSSVFDGNITVLIVSVVMMLLGSGSLKSFAWTLLAGIIFNFVAGVTASRLMIWSLSEFKALNKPSLYTCFSRRVTL